MSSSLAHVGLPANIRPATLVSVLEKARNAPELLRRVFNPEFDGSAKANRISDTAIRVFRHIVEEACRSTDFLPGRICGSWEQPKTIADKLHIAERVYHTAEAELRSVGLLQRTHNAHARRSGERGENGVIIWLSGLSVGPAIDHYPALVEVCDAIELEKQATRALRQEIKQVSCQIRALEIEELRNQAELILPRGRTSRISDTARLNEIKADLEALLVLVELPSADAKSSQQCEEICAPNIPQEDHSENRIAACGPKKQREPARDITPERAASLASEDYQETLTALGGPSWPNLVETSSLTCKWLDISQSVWGEACQIMGRERAALCVLVIDRNRRLPNGHRYHRKHASGTLTGMIRKGNDGLNLMGLLRAIEGYPEGERCKVEPIPPSSSELPSEGTKSVGNAISKLIERLHLEAVKDGSC